MTVWLGLALVFTVGVFVRAQRNAWPRPSLFDAQPHLWASCVFLAALLILAPLALATWYARGRP